MEKEVIKFRNLSTPLKCAAVGGMIIFVYMIITLILFIIGFFIGFYGL